MAIALSRNQLYYTHQLSHEQIDDYLDEQKSQHFPETKAQHLGKLHEFFALSKLFSDNDIYFLPLKGPVLSYRIYQDPLYRSYNDLDFLMSPNTIQKALDVLYANGYQSPFYTFPTDECRKKILYGHMNELFLYHPEKDTGIELHWKLFTGDFVSEKKMQQIIASNQDKIEYAGHQFKVFSIEFEVLYLIIHGGLHHWNKLKWLVDIKDILQRFTLVESHFLNLTKELQAYRLVAVCNELLKIYFPGSRLLPCRAKAPQRLLQFSLQQINRAENEDAKTIRNFVAVFRNSLSAFPGFRYKISIIKHVLFATDLAAKKWMPCSSVIYYLISPFWKLKRGFR